MWSRIVVTLVLIHCLAALPAPEQDTTGSWSADEACQAQTKSSFLENQNDPTCKTFIYCYITNSSNQALVKSCKSGMYFDTTLKVCSINKPQNCA
ncbi:uncharacterized protein [Drosophila bipectinata]|uniref:uncharacterized protein isoform X2 n=1 Tax=Drosophila bipectinata TaxID=42026 RepID=UPI001C8937DC|nr:uncharacterized protein LOC122321397 [Drosophila bipectinata]